jgi:hypothetical protein
VSGRGEIVSTQSRESYIAMVKAGIELVRAGDIFQVNLAQQFSLAATIDPLELHRRGIVVERQQFGGRGGQRPQTGVTDSDPTDPPNGGRGTTQRAPQTGLTDSDPTDPPGGGRGPQAGPRKG